MTRPGFGDQYYFLVDEYGKITLDSMEEQEFAYNRCLDQLRENPRYFLNRLDSMKEFRVDWLFYASKETCERYDRYYGVSYPHKFCFTPIAK